MFHVETTAWEGEHAYEVPSPEPSRATGISPKEQERPTDHTFASYGSYFWSRK